MQTGLSLNFVEEAVGYYNDLLADDELRNSSRQVLDDGLERSKLIFGGRRLTPYLRPHFVTERDWTLATSVCEIIFSTLQNV